MLISDLCAEVILEVGGDTTDATLADTMFKFMKSGMRRLPVWMRSRTLVVTGSFTFPANVLSVNLASLLPNFIREINKDGFWYQDINGKRQPITRLNRQAFNQYANPIAAVTYPKYFHITNKTLEFDSQLTAALTIYSDYFTSLTTGLVASSQFFGDEQQIELVKDLCKEVYYRGYEEDKEKADSAMMKAKVAMDELDDQYMEQEQGDFPDEQD